MRGDLGSPNPQAKFSQMFSNSRAVNVLAAARIFLFASRDVWFVVGVPVYLRSELGWSFWQASGFLAIWVIGYGIVQASAPRFVRRRTSDPAAANPDGTMASWLAFALAAFPAGIAIAFSAGADRTAALVIGLIAFGVVFAMNSAVHSYLILAYAQGEGRHERRLLLHGQRWRTLGRNGPLGGAIRVARAQRVPVGLRRIRVGGGSALTCCQTNQAPAFRAPRPHP